jgi:hypothetical protein
MDKRGPNQSHWTRMAIGCALIAVLWILTGVIGFVVFDRDTPALWVVSVSLLVFAAVVIALIRARRVGWQEGGWALATVGLLVGLYYIPLRADLPSEALERVQAHSVAQEDRYAFARDLFWENAKRFTGPTREYLLQPQRIFLHKSARYFWETEGYMPSHLQTQLYRHMLIASGRFRSDEVVLRTGRCFNSPHGYLEIRHPTREIHADLWAAQTFDDYRFGQVVDMPSCDGLTAEAEPQGEGF